MGMTGVAARRIAKTFTATGSGGALTVASGSPVTVNALTLYAGTTKAVFTITDGANTALFTVGVIADDTFTLETAWKADAGIKVQISSVAGSPSACVFHGNPGN